MVLRFWKPVKRPSQDAVPAHVRKIWLARECFAERETTQAAVAAQEILYSKSDIIVLSGRNTLRTQMHSSFASIDPGQREVQRMLWVPFQIPFARVPAVSVALIGSLPYNIGTAHVACDGFQIVLQVWGEIPERELEVTWMAVGFLTPQAV